MGIITFINDLFSPVLSDRQIKKYIARGELVEGEIQPYQYQPNSIDLRLADSYTYSVQNTWLNGKASIDPQMTIFNTTRTFDNGEFILEPGKFVLMATKERLVIPNGILGFVCGRSSVARLGIQTEQAGLIDSGFKGTITLEVINQSEHPIILRENMRICQVWFIRSKHSELTYGSKLNSKYKGQEDATGSRIYLDSENDKKPFNY